MKTEKGRVLCVTSNFPRWTDDSTTPFVLHLCEDLQKLGWTVDVLAPHAADTEVKETMSGVEVMRFRYLWPESAESVCYQGGALINLRKNPANYLKLPALVFAEWAAVRKLLIRGDYDLLHSHWILPQGLVGSLTAHVKRIPHVITVHGGDVFALRGRVLAGFKRYALRHADKITANSSVTEEAIRKLEPDTASVARIPMGVDINVPEQLDPGVLRILSKYRTDQGPLLLYVGRLVEEKGAADFLDAVAELWTRLPGMTALVVGDGQDRSHLEAYATTRGLNDCVVFTGWVDPAQVPSFMKAADCFVAPSRQASNGWVEAQGLTILEAMACGTPVIATRSGGIVDSVVHEHTGLLVDERSPGQISEAVKRLVSEPQLAARMSDNARSMVESRFSRQASAEAFSRLFTDLIENRRGHL